ncbi:MAG TPA: hypothetical protein VFT20_00520 [Candidatus Limnocylindrales bacterium]|nr:hypothetical protein [Candidatus Limnocylindrales bacterium]
MSPFEPRRAAAPAGAALATFLALALVGCGTVSTSPAAPTPADFQGIAALLLRNGLQVDRIVSGEAGCDDLELGRTAIALDAAGLDQATATRIYVYIFRNRASFERLRPTVDACARSYVTDPAAFESVESSPFVVAGAGPWAPEFRAAVRDAIVEAAGTGG